MKPIKLSICICSLHQRADKLAALLFCLQKTQKHTDEIEILISIDGGQEKVGVKRNRLVSQTQGDFVVHIDDDDLVSTRYVSQVISAIDQNPDVDAITIRGFRAEAGPTNYRGGTSPVVFDYRLGAGGLESETDAKGVIWRSPGHICPIRGYLARQQPFPIVEPEDLVWCEQMKPLIKSAVSAGDGDEILYFYRYDSTKPEAHCDDSR